MMELESKHTDNSTGGLFDGENVTPWESSKNTHKNTFDERNKHAKK